MKVIPNKENKSYSNDESILRGRAQLATPTSRNITFHEESCGRDSDGPGVRVLVVDDSSAIQKVLKRWLESNGCIVTSAENGKNGLALLKEQNFDITFMDFLMVRSNIIFSGLNSFYLFLSFFVLSNYNSL